MDQVKGSMEVLSSLQLTKDKTGTMDIKSKGLLRNKEVLAVILGEVIVEYEGYSREEIMEFIEPDSLNTQTEVSPGRTNTKVMGDSAEFAVLNEKASYFDLLFRAKNPALSDRDVRVSLHVDLEPQLTYQPGYPIEKRGMYYLARMLSSQLSLLTERTDYSQLEKCYSIWICRDDVPVNMRNSVSVYEVTNTRGTGSCSARRENYDLMTLVVIKLGDQVYNGKEEDKDYDLLRFLNAVMYPREGKTEKVVEEFIDLPKNEDLQEEVEHVSGLGESIYKEGRIDGKAEGKAEGILLLLEEYGEIPEDLRWKITSEKDTEQLDKWLKLAAKSKSIEEFQKKICE